MIKVKFEVISLKDQVAVIQDFLSDKNNTSDFIADFFNLNINLSTTERNQQINDIITEIYTARLNDLKQSCVRFQNIWERNAVFINNELNNIFGKEFEFDCVAYVNLNPVWPRYLNEKCFDVNLDANDDYLLLTSAHEIIHFAWFEVWKDNFPQIERQDYDYPNLSWLISEIAIEPIFKFSNLKQLSSAKPAYDYFYTDKINNKTIAEIANEIFKNSKDINNFQHTIYSFFKNNKETNKLIK